MNKPRMLGANKRPNPGGFTQPKRKSKALMSQEEELQRAIAAASRICGPRVLR